MRPVIVIGLWLTVLVPLLAPFTSAWQVHKDTTYGYKIHPPKDWLAPTRDIDSQWIIGKFVSRKDTYYNSPEGGTWRFKPEMTIVAFVHDVIKRKGVRKKEEDDEGIKKTIISLSDPYKDYKDYLKRTYYGGGYYFAAEEESSLKDVPVTCYEVKVEKLTHPGPKRIIAWVYHMEDLDIAVQFEVLEKTYPKQKAEILRSLKSFRTIDREGELPGHEGVDIVSRFDWDELDPVERARRRAELEKEAHEKELAELPKGWKHGKVGRILVLDNYNMSKAKKIAQQCQAVMKWLDKKFDFVGPDEYVRAPILKVFKADDPHSSTFFYGGFLDNIVIEYQHNPGGLREVNFEHVNRRALEFWFYERDRDLYWAMPYWMKFGLEDLIENSRAKGTKLEFPEDLYDRLNLKRSLSEGSISKPRELMMMGQEQFFSGRWKMDEASALVRFLVIGPGSKSKKTRDIFWDYLKNLAQVIAEIKNEEKDKGPEEKPKTEEEEDEYFKRKQNAWKDKEKRVLEETFNRTFAQWKEKDWKAVTAAYMRMIDD